MIRQIKYRQPEMSRTGAPDLKQKIFSFSRISFLARFIIGVAG